MIVFFTPLGIKSLYDNFPDFKQKNTRLACYGNVTAKSIEGSSTFIPPVIFKKTSFDPI